MKIKTYEARVEANLTLNQLSQLTGISKTHLNDIENAKVSPKMDVLETIAKSLNIHISDLYDSMYK